MMGLFNCKLTEDGLKIVARYMVEHEIIRNPDADEDIYYITEYVLEINSTARAKAWDDGSGYIESDTINVFEHDYDVNDIIEQSPTGRTKQMDLITGKEFDYNVWIGRVSQKLLNDDEIEDIKDILKPWHYVPHPDQQTLSVERTKPEPEEVNK